MDKEIIRVGKLTEAIEKAKVPLSTVVKGAGLVFVSGMPPIDRETGEFILNADIVTQTRHCLENVKACLEAAGSSLGKVLKVTVYASNAAHFGAINEVYREHFASAPPARTFVAVGSWPIAFDIEVECIALA